jgi:Glutaminase A six helical-hairpin domain
MPLEESGNMIIMADAYAQAAPGAASVAYLNANYTSLTQWADYLVANLPDPGFQNQTDDFAGEIAHSVNLALKGIVAVAAMGQIATLVGNNTDAKRYSKQAQQFAAYWAKHAQDPSGTHLDLTYNRSDDGNGTWGTTYNAFADALLGTHLVPESVAAEQAAFYPTVSNMFGLPLQVPHSYAKTDWATWIAAWLRDYPISRQLIERVYLYANTTPQRVPFSDLYSTISGNQVGFQARPVQGGIFALLARQALEAQRSG